MVNLTIPPKNVSPFDNRKQTLYRLRSIQDPNVRINPLIVVIAPGIRIPNH